MKNKRQECLNFIILYFKTTSFRDMDNDVKHTFLILSITIFIFFTCVACGMALFESRKLSNKLAQFKSQNDQLRVRLKSLSTDYKELNKKYGETKSKLIKSMADYDSLRISLKQAQEALYKQTIRNIDRRSHALYPFHEKDIENIPMTQGVSSSIYFRGKCILCDD